MPLHTIIILISFYALTFAIKESVLLDRPRVWLIRQHTLLFALFECYFCVGFWSGLIVYLIANPFSSWNGFEMFLWGLCSAGISYVLDVVVDRVSR
jgi:hypothetical protein